MLSIVKGFPGKVPDFPTQLKQWKVLYKEGFGIKMNVSKIKIPERIHAFDRVIVVAKGLTLNEVYDVLARHFPCWRYATEDLDESVPKNDRDPKDGSYAILTRDRREADEELKSLSVDQLSKRGVLGITLLERLLYELKHWTETANHLDVQNWTLCTGSRDFAGGVPYVRWSRGALEVRWSPGRYVEGLCARAVVPCLR